MITEFRYQLDKSSRKFNCPGCGKKRFVKFVNSETNKYLPAHFGRCDREQKCGYFLDPYNEGFGSENKIMNLTYRSQKKIQKTPEPRQLYFDFETFKRTLKGYDRNVFLQNLLHNVSYPFTSEDLTEVVELYRLGTIQTGFMAGGITFPFIDRSGHVRAVQAKLFDGSNHTTRTTFLHSILKYHHQGKKQPLPGWLANYLKNEMKVSCLFGEHLLKDHRGPVALVEAPKTAIYCHLYLKEFEFFRDVPWLAVYNKSSFTFERIKALRGRTVYVFPDLSKDGETFREWKEKATEFEEKLPGTKFIFSDLLEQEANEAARIEGLDIADYLIQMDWRQFRTAKEPERTNGNRNFTTEELIQWFGQWSLPGHPIQIDFGLPVRFGEPSPGAELIKHLNTIRKANKESDEYKGAYLTLVQLKERIEAGKSPLKKLEL